MLLYRFSIMMRGKFKLSNYLFAHMYHSIGVSKANLAHCKNQLSGHKPIMLRKSNYKFI